MAANIKPFLRTPFTDVVGGTITTQFDHHPCADYELNAVECMEAYGIGRVGKEKCKFKILDYFECITHKKQEQRMEAMRWERHKQHFFGDRTTANKYVDPPPTTAY